MRPVHSRGSVDDGAMTADLPREDELPDECPFPCNLCPSPGDCEDCLDCLVWPETVPVHPMPPWTPRARSSPVRARELEEARRGLDVGRRIGLVLRRVRRRERLSQSALAAHVGWTPSSLNRAEQDASPMSLGRVDGLLRRVGHRLAIVEVADRPPAAAATGPTAPVTDADVDEVPDEVWGAADLIARDRRGRRFPPFARLTWEDPMDRDLYRRHGKPLPEWTWWNPGPRSSR